MDGILKINIVVVLVAVRSFSYANMELVVRGAGGAVLRGCDLPSDGMSGGSERRIK